MLLPFATGIRGYTEVADLADVIFQLTAEEAASRYKLYLPAEVEPAAEVQCEVRVAPLLAMVPDWVVFLNSVMPEEEPLQKMHTVASRPPGDPGSDS